MRVADSDVLIDVLRGRSPVAERMARELQAGSVATTAGSVFELMSGARTQRERARIERLLGPMAILPFDHAAGLAAAEVRRVLEKSGTGIGMADYQIAGICLSRQTPLWTRNRSHFERVPGLRVSSLE